MNLTSITISMALQTQPVPCPCPLAASLPLCPGVWLSHAPGLLTSGISIHPAMGQSRRLAFQHTPLPCFCLAPVASRLRRCRALSSKQPVCLLLARGMGPGAILQPEPALTTATPLGLAKQSHGDTTQLGLVCEGRAVHRVPWCCTHLRQGAHLGSWCPATRCLQGWAPTQSLVQDSGPGGWERHGSGSLKLYGEASRPRSSRNIKALGLEPSLPAEAQLQREDTSQGCQFSSCPSREGEAVTQHRSPLQNKTNLTKTQPPRAGPSLSQEGEKASSVSGRCLLTDWKVPRLESHQKICASAIKPVCANLLTAGKL